MIRLFYIAKDTYDDKYSMFNERFFKIEKNGNSAARITDEIISDSVIELKMSEDGFFIKSSSDLEKYCTYAILDICNNITITSVTNRTPEWYLNKNIMFFKIFDAKDNRALVIMDTLE